MKLKKKRKKMKMKIYNAQIIIKILQINKIKIHKNLIYLMKIMKLKKIIIINLFYKSKIERKKISLI